MTLKGQHRGVTSITSNHGMVICTLNNDDYANPSIYYDSKDCKYSKSNFLLYTNFKNNKMSHKYKDKIKNVKFV